ncbi:MAG: class I lanthipeptide [Polaribacter sp.]
MIINFLIIEKSFKSLDLNKKTIAKLNRGQLAAIKGGNRDTIIVNCNSRGATIVVGTKA